MSGPAGWPALMRLLRGSGFIFGCRVAGAALTLLTQLLLARWMGAAELGMYVLAFSWAILLASVATLGLIPAAMRFVAEGLARGEPGYGRAFAGFALRSVAGGSLLLALAGYGLTRWLPWPGGPAPGLAALALSFMPGLALLHFGGGLANAYGRFTPGFLPSNVLRPLFFTILVSAAWLAGGRLDAVLALRLQAAAVFATALPLLAYLWLLLSAEGRAGSERREPGRWLATALRLLPAVLFTGYFPEMINILAGHYLPSAELATLHVSFRVAMLISFGLFAVDAFTGPEIARLHAAGERKRLRAVVDQATRLRFWAAVVAVAGFVLLGRWILGWFGPDFVAGYPLLLILGGGQLIQAAVGPVLRLLSISGHEARCLKVFAAALLLAIVLMALLAPRYGASGAALAASLDILFWALGMRWLAARHLGLRPSFT
ncbi:MAG: hypothetical protein D6727_07915 [Gammaproteobacteria bacterium]|nr:MAG: hypothetical protein D6727_07915 [Gammaproteobacteria bacterium]